MKKAYVSALIASILAGQPVETALANLRTLLVKRGHARLWSQILKATERELTVKLARVTPRVTLAKEGSVDAATITGALAVLGTADAQYDVSIDETLVGGFTVRVGDRVIDKSYKRMLINLYEKITK